MTKKLLLKILILITCHICYSQEKLRFPIVKDGKVGFINIKGELVINPIFEETKNFNYKTNSASVKLEGKWGVIDLDGSFLFRNKHQFIGDYSIGMLPVSVDKKFGLINKKEVFVLPPIYDAIIYGRNNLFWVKKDKKWMLYDIEGKRVSDFKFNNIGVFFNSKALVQPNKKFVVINTDGEIIKKKNIKMHLAKSEGLTPFLNKKWGYMDENYEVVIKQKYDFCKPFSEQIAGVKSGKKWGYINMKGDYIIKPKYSKIFPFKEDVAWVKYKDKWTLIDKKGNNLTKEIYSKVQNFSDGLSLTKKEDQYFFINKKGKAVIQLDLDDIHGFKDGLSLVRKGNKYGYINNVGKFVWDLQN